MIRKVAEEHHHTAEEVRAYLDTAAGIVDELELGSHLKEIAFSKAVDLLAAKQMWHEQVQPTMAIPGHKLHG